MNFDMSNQNNNGLLRFRSAPSSVLHSFVSDIEKTRDVNDGLSCSFIPQSFQDLHDDVDHKPNLINGYPVNPPQLPPHYPRQSTTPTSIDGTSSYSRGMSSSMAMGMEQRKMGSSLLRQNSSPAELFTQLNHPTGYGGIRVGNVINNGEISPSPNRLKRQVSSSSLKMLPQISELEPTHVLNDITPQYPFASWEHQPSQFLDTFTSLKREIDIQNGENMVHHPPMLSHHLSLPKTSGEMAAIEKMIHLQDAVPCKIRAKRGCATHPRSIAERVRRTRISERMRKLQELVPHMDKQTNTSDMLDLVVDYIKDLQEQYKKLKDCRAKCRCS